MRGYGQECFIFVLSLVIFIIHGEVIPEYFTAITQGESMPEQKNSTTVFSRPYKSMIRRKREWLIPPVSIAENDRGPFPKRVVQMKSTAAESMEMFYKITGAGADQEPKGLFTVEKRSGMLWVTKALDREETKEYVLTIHASALSQNYSENPVQLIINVIDQNDNKPVCAQNPFMGEVLERAKINVPFINVTATDLDDPNTANGIVRYKLLNNGGAFQIDPTTGLISLASWGILDRETHAEYKLAVEAADMEGHGLSSTCAVIIKIIDSNDHPPVFSHRKYTFPVQENKIGEIDGRLIVTDRDEPFTANSAVKFTIIRGNEAGLFSISTGPSGTQGVITTTKGLDFEQVNSFSLLVKVENLAPFAVPLLTSTATVSISVQDVNEAPVFNPAEKRTIIHEDFPVGGNVTTYTANDPDTARKQKIRYELRKDFANWLEITDTGLVRVNNSLDREAPFIRGGLYTVLVIAYDDDKNEPATGTGTLVIKLLDVNDNPPFLEDSKVLMCSREPKPVRLSITDPDEPENGPPFTGRLHKEFQSNWTIINDRGEVWLSSLRRLDLGEYILFLDLYDSGWLFQNSSLTVEVCDCEGGNVTCSSSLKAAYIYTPLFYVLAAILCFFLLFLLLILLTRKWGKNFEHFVEKDEDRDNIVCYNEEGGGEQDQDFDMLLLCGGPEFFSADIAPTSLPTLFYRRHLEENEDIESFINENLCTADDDHYVAPYDSVLVFAQEGDGSVAESLSSIQSSISDVDQDFQHLHNWGPRFRKLADMYGGGDE